MQNENDDLKIGVFGGIFNPIHIGHLIICDLAKEELELDKIFFVPTAFPPHKDFSHIIDIKYRITMIDLAIQGRKDFIIYKGEAQREKVSFTIDTLTNISKKFNIKKKNVYLIIGEDNFYGLNTWKNPDRIVQSFNVAVVRRTVSQKEIKRDNFEKFCIFINTPVIDISSTLIRNRVAQRRSIRYLVPEKVEKYILKNGFYR